MFIIAVTSLYICPCFGITHDTAWGFISLQCGLQYLWQLKLLIDILSDGRLRNNHVLFVHIIYLLCPLSPMGQASHTGGRDCLFLDTRRRQHKKLALNNWFNMGYRDTDINHKVYLSAKADKN